MSATPETILQIRVCEDLKHRIATKAFEKRQTLRSFVLHALKDAGVEVDDCDLMDRRKVRTGDKSDA